MKIFDTLDVAEGDNPDNKFELDLQDCFAAFLALLLVAVFFGLTVIFGGAQ